MNKVEFTNHFSKFSQNHSIDALAEYFTVYRHQLPAFSAHLTQPIYDESFNEIGICYSGIEYLQRQRCEPYEIFVSPEACIGDTWLFKDDRSEGRPFPDRMARLYSGSPENIPALFAIKAGNYYYCSDGNHRIYSAFLFEKQVRLVVDGEYTVQRPSSNATK